MSLLFPTSCLNSSIFCAQFANLTPPLHLLCILSKDFVRLAGLFWQLLSTVQRLAIVEVRLVLYIWQFCTAATTCCCPMPPKLPQFCIFVFLYFVFLFVCISCLFVFFWYNLQFFTWTTGCCPMPPKLLQFCIFVLCISTFLYFYCFFFCCCIFVFFDWLCTATGYCSMAALSNIGANATKVATYRPKKGHRRLIG